MPKAPSREITFIATPVLVEQLEVALACRAILKAESGTNSLQLLQCSIDDEMAVTGQQMVPVTIKVGCPLLDALRSTIKVFGITHYHCSALQEVEGIVAAALVPEFLAYGSPAQRAEEAEEAAMERWGV